MICKLIAAQMRINAGSMDYYFKVSGNKYL
jgi:hypothetical protein